MDDISEMITNYLKSKLTKWISVAFVAIATLVSGCVVINQGEEEPNPSIMMKGAVAQIVYSSVKKNPEKYMKVWQTASKVFKALDTTVTMTPEQISAKIKESLGNVAGEYSLIVDGAVNSIFSKFQFKWNSNIDPETLSKYINWIAEAIDMGLQKYSEAVVEAVGSIPDELNVEGLFEE